MHNNNFVFRTIKARIFHSYETDMDNSMNQLEIHIETLVKRFDSERFTNPLSLEEEICLFLTELQDEVDALVGVASYGMAFKRIK